MMLLPKAYQTFVEKPSQTWKIMHVHLGMFATEVAMIPMNNLGQALKILEEGP